MNKLSGLSVLLLSLLSNTLWAASSVSSSADESAQSVDFVSVSVDQVVVDTAGLEAASAVLASSVDRLAQAISQPSEESSELTDEHKQILLEAVASAHRASVALTELARQLPQSAQIVGERLPQMLGDARDSVAYITESLPQATQNATQLVDTVLDSALQRLIVYSIVLIAIIALALIAIMWFIYRQYLRPLTQKLDELVGAPEHLEAMSLHMRETSHNLLVMQNISLRSGRRGSQKFRRELRR